MATINEILNLVEEDYKDKFICKEDLEDFLQEVSYIIYRRHRYLNVGSNTIQYYYGKCDIEKFYNKFSNKINEYLDFKNNNYIDYYNENNNDLDDIIYLNNIHDIFNIILKKEPFTEREQKVLELRFGLNNNDPKTLEELAKYFNLTRERIRQIEAKALRKLRHPKRSNLLKYNFGYNYKVLNKKYINSKYFSFNKIRYNEKEYDCCDCKFHTNYGCYALVIKEAYNPFDEDIRNICSFFKLPVKKQIHGYRNYINKRFKQYSNKVNISRVKYNYKQLDTIPWLNFK